MDDPTRRNIESGRRRGGDGRESVFAQQPGKEAPAFYEKRPRSHPLPGNRVRLPVDADFRWRVELDDQRPDRQLPFTVIDEFKGRVPLHRGGPAQRQHRPVHRSCRGRSAVGLVRRRPPRPDGSPGHRQVHGDGVLHRRPLHLESPEARAQSCCRGGGRAAGRVAAGDARPEVPGRLLEDLGSGTDGQAPRDHDADGRRSS